MSKKYIFSSDADYVKIGNMRFPTDMRDYGYESAQEVSRKANAQYAEEKRQEEEARILEEKRQAAKATYDEVYRDYPESGDVQACLEYLFNALVPSSGKCENVGGELVRAINRLLYRSWNDGDVFYSGYGKETCASSAEYIIDKVIEYSGSDKILDKFTVIAQKELEDEEYDAALYDIAKYLLDFLQDHMEVFGEPVTESDGSRDYSGEYSVAEMAPEYSYDVDTSGDLERYIENGCVSWDDVYYFLEDLARQYGGTVHQRARDWFEIDDLDKEEYQSWDSEYFNDLERWLDDLEREYPNFGEKDENEEAEWDDDEEEDEYEGW